MRRVLVASLLAAACSGTVRSSTSTIRDDGNGGTPQAQGGARTGGSSGRGATGGTGGAAGAGGVASPCSNGVIEPCQCFNGLTGQRQCVNSIWSACLCSVMRGTGGGPPVCAPLTAQPCLCLHGTTGYQTCEGGGWGPCMCAAPATGGQPNRGTGGAPDVAVCGDGVISRGEQCDGQNMPDTCASVSMGACLGGYLICTANCIYDYTACVCGVADGGP
jgi:hypothetical protein